MTHSTRLRRGLLVGVTALALIAAACGGDDDDSDATTATTAEGGGATGGDIAGKTIQISGSETASEAEGFTISMDAWAAETGAKYQFTGTRDFETQIRVAAEGGTLPDIALFPQPGLAKDPAIAPKAAALPQSVIDSFDDNFDPFWRDLMTVEGKPIGIPIKADLKGTVYYSPAAFEEGGYEIPKTMDELKTLSDKMKADGKTPWCVGIESGDATGWPFTDWMEDIMLRLHGPEVYDQWVSHNIPFNDPKVKEVAEYIGDIWFEEGNVAGGRESIASTGFQQAGLGVTGGDCMMYRLANFYTSQYKTENPDVTFGPEGDINVFKLPLISDEFGDVTLSAGLYAVAFNDKPETVSAMEYLSSADYSNNRIKANKGGFLSPNKNTDTSLYADEIDRIFNDILIAADPVRFDASDLMPGAVGAGSFWKNGTNFVNGTETVDEFLDNVEKSWP
jgi:alpha-glucoside transport system substrate-binding protein